MTLSEEIDGAILYTDGGFLLDRKIGGWGVHGYTYKAEEPKRGTGNPKAIPTVNGYQYQDLTGDKVTIVNYFDLVGGCRDMHSSGEVELHALYHGLNFLKEHPFIKNAKLYSDAKYVVVGVTQHLERWVERKWLLSNGEPVKYRPMWEKVKELYDHLKANLDSLEIAWVKGHNGHPGNEKADQLAGRGLVLGIKKDSEHFREIKEAQGYWNARIEVPRILQAPRWYFSTSDLDYKWNGEGATYYVGTHGTKDKEDDLPGKRYSDNFLGVVRMVKADPTLETLRLTAIARDGKKLNSLVVGSLDTIFSPKIFNELYHHQTRFILEHPKRIDLTDSRQNPILTETSPPGLSFRLMDRWNILTRLLDEIQGGESDGYCLTDITDLLYEAPDEKKGTRKLSAKISQVTKYLDLMVEFNLAKSGEEPNPFQAKIRLILGSDILTRNQLAALADDVSSVKVVSWRESDNVGRYATLVELKSGDVGLWARFEANIYYRTGDTINP